MDRTIRQVRRAQWIEIIRACRARPAGQTVDAWLSDNGIKRKTYYSWLRTLRLEAAAEMKGQTLPQAGTSAAAVTFVEVPSPAAAAPVTDIAEQAAISGFRPDAVIYIGGSAVAVTNSASTALLERIVEVMNHAR